ncbi:hypothetical protein ACGC1H_005420 [Rhizoctonia solani]
MKRKSEEPDITASGSSDLTLKAGETRRTEVSREVLIEEPRPSASKLPIRILIVGPSGFGKTQTINDFRHSTKEPTVHGMYQPTKHVIAQRFHFEGEIIELIDTPGFDNIGMSDLEAFTEIAEHLLNPKRIQKGIAGIIYVHRAGNTVRNRSMLRNFRVLTNIFLGHTGITRLTFLVTQTGTQGVGFQNILDEMKARGSVFGYTFPAGAAIAATPNRAGFIATLRSYLSQTPIMLPVQLNDSYKSHATFAARIEKELGYYEYKSAQSLLDGLEQQLRADYEHKLVDRCATETQLQRELQKTQLEYSSLRSQLQLQENIEQSQVVQTLHDLNRMIEDLGRSISSYLYDEYVAKSFDVDLADVTTLNASDLPTLKSLAGHKHDMTSFIQTTNGQGMQIECFLDFMIRNKICLHLAREIFSPFHPGINPSLNQVLRATFENIQKQVPQVIAGKWRSNTFKYISLPEQQRLTIDQQVNTQLNTIIDNDIMPLTRCVFGKDITIIAEHHSLLRAIIQRAWDWNATLKEDVIMLGEFRQVTYPHYSRFDPNSMVEFEASSRNTLPVKILGTLALGLKSQRAVGGGIPVEETMVSKAIVLTKNVYT